MDQALLIDWVVMAILGWLVIGVIEVLIGFWAVAYIGRAVFLLVVWVAAAALARGLSDLFISFGLHGAHARLRQSQQI